MTVSQLVEYAFSSGSPIGLALQTVNSTVLLMVGALSVVGIVMYLIKLVLGHEQVEAQSLLRFLLLPVALFALLMPISISNLPYGLGVQLVKWAFDGGAYVADKLAMNVKYSIDGIIGNNYTSTNPNQFNSLPSNTLIYYGDFTELATNFRDVANASANILAEDLKNNLKQEVVNVSSYQEHTTGAMAVVGFIIGALTGLDSALSSGVSLSPQMLTKLGYSVVGGGVKGALTYALLNIALGYAVDFVWRLSIILWIMKFAAMVILTPIAIVVGLVSFHWGVSNIGRFLLNVIGIAITPAAMIAIFVGGLYGYSIAIQVLHVGGIVGFIYELFIAVAFPVILGIALMRVGEIISYVIGVSAFVFSSVAGEYTRPSRFFADMIGK